MKTYESVNDYLKNHKVGDRILLGGRGIISGLKAARGKHDTYKVAKGTTTDKIKFTIYGGRKVLTTCYYDQKVGVLTKEEFNNLIN